MFSRKPQYLHVERRRALRLAIIALTALIALSGNFSYSIQPTALAATVFTVTSTGDGGDSNTSDGVCDDGTGHCTLRAAIQQANSTPGTDTINFSIGSGPQTIAPASGLPVVTDPVVIDGTTQPGFAGSPLIELTGATFPMTAALEISAGNSVLRGLLVNRFYTGVTLSGGGGNRIEGNYFGTNLAGNAPGAPGANPATGLDIYSSNNIIGGTTAAKRNVISANGFNGISILGNDGQGATGNIVQGNYIGTDATGTVALPNHGNSGIIIWMASGNIIGGTAPGEGNVISGNDGSGIIIYDDSSTGNSVVGNRIGTAADGVTPLPNNSNGVHIRGGINNVIGGTAGGAGNIIAFNKDAGVLVNAYGPPGSLTGYNNAIRGNAIFANEKLGIALQPPAGPPVNPAGATDKVGNNLQNYPVINNVTLTGSTATIQGTLNSKANTVFKLDFFVNSVCDPSGNGEGQSYLGSAQVTTAANGNAAFNLNFTTTLQAGHIITATATDPGGNTSEFSPCNTSLSAGFLQFSAPIYNVIEDIGTMTFTVTRTNGTKGAVSVNYATSNGTAIAGADYTATSGTLAFADGEASKTFGVAVTSDAITEPDETVNLTLSNPTGGAALGVQSKAVVNILDGSKTPVLSVSSESVKEGNAGTVNVPVTVSLSAARGKTVTVHYNTFAMTALSPADFQAAGGTLTFAPGVTSQTINLSVFGDALNEVDETFRVGLSNATNAAISVSSNPPLVTIIDDDPLPTVSVSDATATESNTGTVNAVFTVTLSSASGRNVTVRYSTNPGTASHPEDYQQTIGQFVFAPGQTTKTINVPVFNDAAFEGTETFTFYIDVLDNATVTREMGIGTILDNDSTPTLSVDDVTVVEDDGGLNGSLRAVFTISLSATSNQQVSFSYTAADVTATGATSSTPIDTIDYYGVFGGGLFAPGITKQTIEVRIAGDLRDEPDEYFKLVLSNVSGAALGKAQGVATIKDNDPPPTISIKDAIVSEGSAGTSNADFEVKLSTASGKTVSVNYATADATASAASDYQARSGQLIFNPGETSKFISVAVNGDTLTEQDETFLVTLTTPLEATLGDGQATGTIYTDEGPTRLRFKDVSYSASEDAVKITATVIRPGDLSGVSTVDYLTSDGSASQTNDYTTASGSLRFAAGEFSKTFTVLLTDDLYVETNEIINVALSNPSGATINDPSAATLLIIDNDPAPAGFNPIDEPVYFVRQNYADFLSREPDKGGLDYWSGQIYKCGVNTDCINFWRAAVSAAFFIELEFQNTGSFVYRFYKASYGVRPTYAQFTPDRARLVDTANLEQNKQNFSLLFVQRPEFVARYPLSLGGAAFVDALLQSVQQSSQVNLSSQRENLIAAYNNAGGGDGGRAAALRVVAEDQTFIQAEYNKAFVLMQYFGYLKRDPDEGGYLFWLGVVNNSVPNDPSGYRSMVCAFITSREYQLRFNGIVTRNDSVCAPQ